MTARNWSRHTVLVGSAGNGPAIEDDLMFTSNPFADLAEFLPPIAMQVYIILMLIAVVMG